MGLQLADKRWKVIKHTIKIISQIEFKDSTSFNLHYFRSEISPLFLLFLCISYSLHARQLLSFLSKSLLSHVQ